MTDLNSGATAEDMYAVLLGKLSQALCLGKDLKLIGIASGGVLLAQRLAKDLNINDYGVIDVSFYRDDFSEKGRVALNSLNGMSTKIPFSIDGRQIILVDDVLDTGRTIRAALNELFDYGRPSKVDLAVLVDRNRREIPIAPTFSGGFVDLSDNDILVLNENKMGLLSFCVEKA